MRGTPARSQGPYHGSGTRVGFLDWLRRRKGTRCDSREETHSVEFDEREVRHRMPDGEVEKVQWDDLRAIFVRNTDQGPLVPDVFWILWGGAGGCFIPWGAKGSKRASRPSAAVAGIRQRGGRGVRGVRREPGLRRLGERQVVG